MRPDFLVPQRVLSQWDFIPTSETIIILHTAFLSGVCFDFWSLCQSQAIRPASSARCFINEQHLPPSSMHVLAHFRTDRQAGTRNQVVQCSAVPKAAEQDKAVMEASHCIDCNVARSAASLRCPPLDGVASFSFCAENGGERKEFPFPPTNDTDGLDGAVL